MKKVFNSIRFQFKTFLNPFLVFTVAQNQISKFSNSIKSFRTRWYQSFFRFVLFVPQFMEAAAFARQWLKNVEIETSEEIKIKRIWLENQHVGVGDHSYVLALFCWSVAHITGHEIKSKPFCFPLFFSNLFYLSFLSSQLKGITIVIPFSLAHPGYATPPPFPFPSSLTRLDCMS